MSFIAHRESENGKLVPPSSFLLKWKELLQGFCVHVHCTNGAAASTLLQDKLSDASFIA